MASLKEIKNRITSVQGTQKITSAMKMVASAKLHKGQRLIENALPYQRKMEEMLAHVQLGANDFDSPFSEVRDVKKVAMVIFSSNTGLCGTFNANVIKQAKELIAEYKGMEILIYPVGKKIAKALAREGYPLQEMSDEWEHEVSPSTTNQLASQLMDLFLERNVDKVVLLYHRYHGKSTQLLTCETFLPFHPEADDRWAIQNANFIFEPGCEELLTSLYPRYLKYKLYAVYLSHNVSEHSARMIAMQTATDNADSLLTDLNVYYNKTRQQSITNELLDIMGGSGR